MVFNGDTVASATRDRRDPDFTIGGGVLQGVAQDIVKALVQQVAGAVDNSLLGVGAQNELFARSLSFKIGIGAQLLQ